MTRPLRLILHNIRSLHNVGQILRTADGSGVEAVIMTGFTPYPRQSSDDRPGYIVDRVMAGLAKTALGAEQTVQCHYFDTLAEAVNRQHKNNYAIAALEQAENATNLLDTRLEAPTALILGNEVDGLTKPEIALADHIWEIPMRGHKESLNVASAAAVACYQLLR